jgi:transcription antitermination factor NusG
MNWYVCNITSGYEQKIKNTIEMADSLRKIQKKALVPTVKRKRFIRDRMFMYSEKIFPGYVFIMCNDESFNEVANVISLIPGVLNMSGIKGTRRLVSQIDEVEMGHVLNLMDDFSEKNEEVELAVKVNMKVRINSGPFATFQGIISDINKSTNKETKVKVNTLLFNNEVSTIVVPISCVEPV